MYPASFASGMPTVWPVGRGKVNRCKTLARALHVHTAPQLIKSYGAKQALPRCTHVPSLVSLAQSFLKPEDPMSKKVSSPGACSLHPTGTATTKAHRLLFLLPGGAPSRPAVGDRRPTAARQPVAPDGACSRGPRPRRRRRPAAASVWRIWSRVS